MSLSAGSSLLDLVAVVTILVVVTYGYIKWSYQYWRRRNVPYLEPTIPFGNFQNFLRRTQSEGLQIKNLYHEARARGWKFCGIYAVTVPVLLVTDLDLLKVILTKDFSYFMDRGIYTNEKDDPMSAHLFAVDGKKWRDLRTKLTPTFTSGKMKAMFQTLAGIGAILEDYIANNVADKEAVDIKDLLGRYTTDVIGTCAFGIECNSFQEPNSPFRVYGKKAFDRSGFEALKMVFALSFPNVARSLGLRRVKKDVSDFYTKVVNDVVSYRKNNNVVKKDFLQLLIDLKNEQGSQNGVEGDKQVLTMEELAAQCYIFFLAGFETTSTTLAFTLFELANHPEIQEKVREEINAVLPKYADKMTYEFLSELKYMDQVISETLRKYPPVQFLTRRCIQDYKVPCEDLIIEKDTLVTIPLWGIHYDTNYYKNPDDFDPDRFSKENRKNLHRYAYIPFGEGPRICIGERFGLMQTKVALTSVLRRNKVMVDNKTKVPLEMEANNLTPTVKGGIWINLEKI